MASGTWRKCQICNEGSWDNIISARIWGFSTHERHFVCTKIQEEPCLYLDVGGMRLQSYICRWLGSCMA